jgi:hypothetical protein
VRNFFAVSVLITVTATALCAQTARQPITNLSGAAKLISYTGRIVVQRSTPWRLDIGEYVYPMEVVTTGPDGSGVFKVADGSTFEVFPNSRVAFRTNGGNWEDLLELWLGKVKVQIEHPGGVPNYNKVRTPTAVISVRGTVFDVEFDADAGATTVLDEEGTVEVARALRLDDKKVLNAGEGIKVYKNDPLARSFDKGDALKRVFRAAMDAVTQQAINARTGTPSAGGAPAGTSSGGGTVAGDKNTNTAPPPPPPPPPPAK